ncbi:MAG: glycosyltransferase [Bacteroidetes bacterium]|nr:glycosyltransferase [Bacteroidota bacterium]MCY4233619.1 glycosyltransferase [Bacteroidota bacterium]
MNNVLVIAYYFPPLGLSGVQRTAGFVRHLPKYGWQPTVLTAKPAGYFAYDESLWTPIEAMGISVIRTPSLDPTRMFRSYSTVTLPPERKRKVLSSLSNWLFVPDNKIGWMPFAILKGINQLKRQRFDLILSTAPPYTGHMIACHLSKKLNIPLMIDFRDDWVGNPRHDYPTKLHRKIHFSLESKVLNQSSAVISINQQILDQLSERHPELKKITKVIPHGYDERVTLTSKSLQSVKHLRFLYTGVFYDAQVPDYFLRGLSYFLSQNPELSTKVHATFAGLVPKGFNQLLKTFNLTENVEFVGYKQHNVIQQLQQEADILWMTIGSRAGNNGISTGKLFEYIGTRKPILALVPDGAARDTLVRYGATYLANPTCIDSIIQAFNDIKTDWLNQNLPTPDESFASMFNRHRLTETLTQVFHSVIKSR